MRAVVNVSTGKFKQGQDRLREALLKFNPKTNGFYWHTFPPGPSHEKVPYGFKISALKNAIEQGADVLLWADSSIVPIMPLSLLWDLIEHRQGYWFSENYHGTRRFCSDQAAQLMGLSRKQLDQVPHVIATAFGLNMKRPIARQFLLEWERMANLGVFETGGSEDEDFVAHRHDQTAASVIAWKLGMNLTSPPDWIAEGGQPHTDKTLLTIERIR